MENFTVTSRILMLAKNLLQHRAGHFERLVAELEANPRHTRWPPISVMEMSYANRVSKDFSDIDRLLIGALTSWSNSQPECIAPVKSLSPVTSPVQGDQVQAPTKKRKRDPVDPVIELIQRTCSDPQDAAEIWGKMEKMAVDGSSIFSTSTPTGLKYSHNGVGKHFTPNALKKRLNPASRGASGKNKRTDPPA